MSFVLGLEALLVASPEPVPLERLYQALDRHEVDAAVAELASFWADRGMVLLKKGGGISLVPSPLRLKTLMEIQGETVRSLSAAAIETLCFIALHQPVTISDIEEARGLKLYKGVMDSLLDSGFVRAAVRRGDSGRAITYVTTETFLEHFGLSSLGDLPNVDELPDLIGRPSEDPES